MQDRSGWPSHFSPSAGGAGKSVGSLIKGDKVEAGGEAGLVVHQLLPGRTDSESRLLPSARSARKPGFPGKCLRLKRLAITSTFVRF